MPDVTEALPWFQAASPIVAAVGIAASTIIGVTALNANRRQRKEQTRPNLLFIPRGETVEVRATRERVFPGKDPGDPELATFFRSLPDGTRALRLAKPFGELRNYGSGPAFDILLLFRATHILADGAWRPPLSGEKARFEIEGFDELRPAPAHLASGATASIGTLPGTVCFVWPGMSGAKGWMTVRCTDMHGQFVEASQEAIFELGAEDEAGNGELTISFGSRDAAGGRLRRSRRRW